MPSNSPASVIVSCYNDLAILEPSLAALSVQSFRDFELIIADDGSTQDYAPVLVAWAPRFAYGIQHVTHEKKGYRRPRILNRAIHVSRFDRVIIMDMDCLPHRDFVRNHLAYLRPGIAITGRRVDISRDALPTAEQILGRGVGFSLPVLLRMWLQGKAKRVEHGFVSPIFYESNHAALLGCNFSLYKSDLQSLNGLNEEIQGWGGDDTELDLRIHFMGAKIRNLRNKVIEYHLTHPHREAYVEHRDAIIARTRAEKAIRSRLGLSEIQASDFSCTRFGPAK
jgi:glycosyltransferase involved in cell wall biosynthesis